ncbi:hypothetical protein GWO43_16295 [candidate division KSB1 bacterium]|nr:hypothetical protein [candidate division KSB1 bacterium]NIR68694.1 hypothetical protein [candidate division KSB1 bacterium]NIS25511.1 hypothetical protein [candidate division KSB1 bacterium]NIT72404.1 hypothetical protein [candidate division KSB1 bacterium]NIU26188.1 hypothetical protein [candidate division KSB1 bacterium]
MQAFLKPRRSQLELTALLSVVILIIGFRFSPAEKVEKRYPASHGEKYWFDLRQDLIFSEEFPLPGYEASDYGRVEYPAIAVDSKKNVYVAYNYTSDRGDEAIYLNHFSDESVELEATTDVARRYLKITDGPDWEEALQVSEVSETEYRPRLTVTPEDVVWVVWSARRNQQWEIFARTFSEGKFGEEIRVTENSVYDFRPVTLADRSGRVWLLWERGTSDKNMQIVAKFMLNGNWSDEIILEGRPGYAYRPAILEAGDGTIWFAWDHTNGHNTDVYVNSFKNGTLGEPVQVSFHPGIDCKAALSWHQNKLWVAWTTNRRGENDWGIIRYPMVRAYDGQSWFTLPSEMKGVDLKSQSEMQSYEYPTMTFDSYGRLYLFNRHDHVFSAAYYENGEWSDNWLLDEAGWGLRGFYVHLAWVSENKLWMAHRDRKTVFLQKMIRQKPRQAEIKLWKYEPADYPERLATVEEDIHRGPRAGDYRVYFGDLHVHTAYSDGSGSFDELYTLYKNVYKVDFLAITDHDALRLGNNHFSPGEWGYLKALNEIYNQPGEFVTINGYEWTHSTWSGRQDSSVRIGHKNVYFKGGEESPFFNHHGNIAYDAVSLFRTLHDHEAIAFPHHPPWGGITWEDHDPDIETNYEIVSIHGANEYMGNLPIPHRGGMPGAFAQDGLARGEIFGFVGASDSHGLYYHAHEGWREDAYKGGWTGVLLDGPLTRENVWLALKGRRNYATAGEKYYLEFAINGHPMGSSITVNEPPQIVFEVRSYDILYAYIIRNNEELFISGKIGGPLTAYKGLTDDTIPPGKNFYYLRVVFKDGKVAWSSPIWVEYLPD